MDSDELAERFLNLAAEIIKLFSLLSKTYVGRHVGGQLVRAATSAGANYEEARGAESKADFIYPVR